MLISAGRCWRKCQKADRMILEREEFYLCIKTRSKTIKKLGSKSAQPVWTRDLAPKGVFSRSDGTWTCQAVFEQLLTGFPRRSISSNQNCDEIQPRKRSLSASSPISHRCPFDWWFDQLTSQSMRSFCCTILLKLRLVLKIVDLFWLLEISLEHDIIGLTWAGQKGKQHTHTQPDLQYPYGLRMWGGERMTMIIEHQTSAVTPNDKRHADLDSLLITNTAVQYGPVDKLFLPLFRNKRRTWWIPSSSNRPIQLHVCGERLG